MHWFDLFDLQFGSIVMCEKITQCCHCVINWKKYLRSKFMQGEPPLKVKEVKGDSYIGKNGHTQSIILICICYYVVFLSVGLTSSLFCGSHSTAWLLGCSSCWLHHWQRAEKRQPLQMLAISCEEHLKVPLAIGTWPAALDYTGLEVGSSMLWCGPSWSWCTTLSQ